ncbi:aldo/keto reductase [Demequina silvatica]|uniref:aldo/keto reductase n=1 Tax=Demequina silvatica TaxID=1638988 RepID=UPI0009E1FC99|nr:aldo/keto reductase [Demequina silvatica]
MSTDTLSTHPSDRPAAGRTAALARLGIPQLGLGVFDMDHETTATVVASALELGYRSIDTAAIYGNEAAVGEGIRRAAIPREELFVTTKLWIDAHGVEEAQRAAEDSLRQLGLDQVDLYLIHWPHSVAGRHREAWLGLERVADRGLASRIGVCNFSTAQLDDLIALGGRVPTVNQIELHPFHTRAAEMLEDDRRGIVTESWSPLARGRVFSDPLIARLAELYGVSAAQIVLRWHVQQGLMTVPKSANPARLAENLTVFDFELEPAHMVEISALDRGECIEPDYYALG